MKGADKEMQNLFQFYSDSFMLVSVDSFIIDDIILFQRLKVDQDVFVAGESRYAKLKYYYFDELTRITEVTKFLKQSGTGGKSIDQWRTADRHLAFVADMDAQFLFVPKTWLRYILMVKIARV